MLAPLSGCGPPRVPDDPVSGHHRMRVIRREKSDLTDLIAWIRRLRLA
jgi:hypothetical protein